MRTHWIENCWSPVEWHAQLSPLSAVQDPARRAQDKVLFTFSSQEDLSRWKPFTDQAFGGSSTAALAQAPDGVRPAAACDVLSHQAVLSWVRSAAEDCRVLRRLLAGRQAGLGCQARRRVQHHSPGTSSSQPVQPLSRQ